MSCRAAAASWARSPDRSSTGEDILDAYVELELAGEDPARHYPEAIHLRSCPGCAADHAGLLEAMRRYGDAGPG